MANEFSREPGDEDYFDRLMDAHQTLIQLKAGDVVDQRMVDDLLLIEKVYREEAERATDAFHRGYDMGLRRAAGIDTAKLVEERDAIRMELGIAEARLGLFRADNERLREALENPPKHKFWGAGELDCPREIKAGNGELHTLRCKVCGIDSPRDEICRERVL